MQFVENDRIAYQQKDNEKKKRKKCNNRRRRKKRFSIGSTKTDNDLPTANSLIKLQKIKEFPLMKNIQNCSLNFVFNNQPFCLSLFFSLKHNNLSLNFCTQNHPQPNELTISKFLFAFLLPFFVCCTLHFQYQSNDLILSVTSSLNNSILIINPFGKKGSVKKR